MRKSITNRLISLTEIDIRESKTPKFSPAALKNNTYVYLYVEIMNENYMYFEGKFI